jgi:hypothetical protein
MGEFRGVKAAKVRADVLDTSVVIPLFYAIPEGKLGLIQVRFLQQSQ